MREIVTNLPNEKKYGEMIASVIGQLSDGAWENSNRCRGYWIFAESSSDSNNNIAISEDYYDTYWNTKNPYRKMSDTEIKKYFARKIKELVLMELEHNHEREISDLTLKDMRYSYLSYEREEYLRRRAEYEKMLKENPFVRKGKFTIDNDTELCYISYDERITVGDAYKAYKILME